MNKPKIWVLLTLHMVHWMEYRLETGDRVPSGPEGNLSIYQGHITGSYYILSKELRAKNWELNYN